MTARGSIRLVLLTLAVTVWAGFLSGCSPAPAEGPAPPSASAATAAPVLTEQPADRAADVSPGAPATVAVTSGRLDQVGLTAANGTPVAGSESPDGRRWTSTVPLTYATTYTYRGTATGTDGRVTPVAGSFRTVTAQTQVQAAVNIPDGDTVGIAAPIVVQFDHHVTDKAAAQRAMQVRTSVPTPGSWAWLPDTADGSRAHWRPQNYWTPGTQVDLTANLLGVAYGGGAWGKGDVSSHFVIGRSQIVRADVNSHQMVVVRDGQTVMTLPASYGLGSDPQRNTTNGIHVVMSKDQTVLMSNPKYGYVNKPEHWAVRISDDGEFIHANPDTTGDQGSDNVTHGCVNLSTADAQAYFATAIFGDPVEVTGSPVPMARTDIYDWSVPWNEWTAMSAVQG